MKKNNSFSPARWLRNPHLQTAWPSLMRRLIKLDVTNERLELPDGDFVDLVWVGKNTGPIVVVLHGLAGNIHSPYAKGILHAISANGWRGVFMHFRGCSGVPNRLPRAYHSGETSDLEFLIKVIRERERDTPLAAVGFSLGGNVLIKWLGETCEKNPLTAAIAISVPFELHKTVSHLNQGSSRIYQWFLLRQLRTSLKKKFASLNVPIKIDLTNLDELNTFLEFDNKITAPLHGFKNAHDYYQRASSRPFLNKIKVPTLILQARDDPFVPSNAIPQQHELSNHVSLEITDNGGHMGFVAGTPWKPIYWIEERVISFLQDELPN